MFSNQEAELINNKSNEVSLSKLEVITEYLVCSNCSTNTWSSNTVSNSRFDIQLQILAMIAAAGIQDDMNLNYLSILFY